MIKVQITREDGEVSLWEGDAAIVLVMKGDPDLSTKLSEIDPPIISLRCDTNMQISVMLAGLIAQVRHLSPDALSMAMDLARHLKSGIANPTAVRRLPPRFKR